MTYFDQFIISGSDVHDVSIGYKLNHHQRELTVLLICHVGITVLTSEGW